MQDDFGVLSFFCALVAIVPLLQNLCSTVSARHYFKYLCNLRVIGKVRHCDSYRRDSRSTWKKELQPIII